MRLIHVGSFTYALALACALAGLAPASSVTTQANGSDASKGRAIFRYDTFGDEQLWTARASDARRPQALRQPRRKH